MHPKGGYDCDPFCEKQNNDAYEKYCGRGDACDTDETDEAPQQKKELNTPQDGNITVEQLAERLLHLDNFSIYCFGVRRTGKTFLLNHVLDYIDTHVQYDLVVLMSETSFKGDQWQQIPPKYKHSGYRPEVIASILKEQHKTMKHNAQTEKIDQKPMPRVLIVLDDVMGDRRVKWGNDADVLGSLYFQGRHLNIDVISILQDPKALPPKVRNNSDIIVAFRSMNMLHRKDLIESYLSCAPGREAYKAGEAYYEQVFRTKHSALIIDLAHSAGCKDFHQFAWRCEAPSEPPERYTMGTPELWTHEE